MRLLEVSAAAGQNGPVIVLSGETDVMTAWRLSEVITAQLSAGTRHLTVDMSRLRYADSTSARVLWLAAKTLTDRGGGMILVRPRPAVIRTLTVLGVAEMFTIRPDVV